MTETILERRERLLGPNVTTFYDDPIHLIKGDGVWLWDAAGRKYLDCYNNVPHVGHANPVVVEAIAKQAATLNTHTRYVHELILDYTERLTATMDTSLTNTIMTCTGSEANDIAIRMAEGVTGKRGVIVTDFTYHGNTALVSQLSQSNTPSVGYGLNENVRFVPAPDSYSPLGATAGAAHAQRFADAVAEQIGELERAGIGFSALLVCPYFVNEGFPDLPPGWLEPAITAVRNAGGMFIADEVQPGFGRLGSHFWGHQYQRVTPDIVTMGKPMANGHPVGAVVTSKDIMATFRNAFRYFNTFGGNPVSCAAAMAVLDEIDRLELQQNAADVGGYALTRLRSLAERHAVIGDVRGKGMLFGAELVLDRSTKEPATDLTAKLVNMLRDRGIILSSLGRYKNMLKIRPPMPFSSSNVDLLIETLDGALQDVTA